MDDKEIVESLRSRLSSRRSLRHRPHTRSGTGDRQLDKDRDDDPGMITRPTSSIHVKPIIKFRRKSRAVLHIIQLSRMSMENMTADISLEHWYAMFDSDDVTNNENQPRKRPRPFVTFVPNEQWELTQLTFDLSHFKQDESPTAFLTDSIRNILLVPPNERTSGQISKVIKYLKALFEKFRNYPLAVQRLVAQRVHYDRFTSDRVLFKRGQNSSGMYFVLSGLLTEKHHARRKPNDVTGGAVLGEYDLVCGCKRQNSVVTRADTDLLYLDKKDYQEIFDMAEDSSDPKHLEIVRQHIVFQHFPISKLEESPEAWTIIKYKYGRLIAQDSNTVEWIYVIKSGEARVLKYLQPSEMDIVQRRKKLQAVLRAQSPFYIKHKILNFVTERDHIQTSYSRFKYHPVTRSVMSAPPDALRSQKPNISSRKGALGSPALKQRCNTGPPIVRSTNQLRDRTFPQTQQRPKTRASVCNENINGPESSNKLPEIRVDEVDNDDNKPGDEILVETDQSPSKLKPVQNVLPECYMKSDNVSSDGAQRAVTKDVRKTIGIKTESKAKRPSTASDMVKQRTSRQVVHHGKYSLPAFVQVETLSQGDVFGLRACLEPEERGPSVSLVSGNCEVLQINKKFFIRHCDDALYGLIRLKAKPFPSEEDLIDRLDVGMQWEEYKQRIVTEFLQGRRRIR